MGQAPNISLKPLTHVTWKLEPNEMEEGDLQGQGGHPACLGVREGPGELMPGARASQAGEPPVWVPGKGCLRGGRGTGWARRLHFETVLLPRLL